LSDPSTTPARSAVFARQVRQRRERRGWSQGELASRLAEVGYPLGQSRVSAIEAPGPEPRTVSLDQAEAFARVFEVPIEQLLSEDGLKWVGQETVARELAVVVQLADEAVMQMAAHANYLRNMARRVADKAGIDVDVFAAFTPEHEAGMKYLAGEQTEQEEEG
jgi:transcriptional regulator with XRE-family HTH domain